MTFWQWFKVDGDKLCNFVSLLSIACKAEGSIPPWITSATLIAGIVATAAHQSFFPTSAQSGAGAKQ